MERSEVSYMGVFDFYKGRITSARNYGLSGDGILDLVRRCAFWDSFLTNEEFNSIIIMCCDMHKKIMEDNRNETWNRGNQ